MMRNKTKVRFKQARASKNTEPAQNYIFFSVEIKSSISNARTKKFIARTLCFMVLFSRSTCEIDRACEQT